MVDPVRANAAAKSRAAATDGGSNPAMFSRHTAMSVDVGLLGHALVDVAGHRHEDDVSGNGK